MAIFYVRPDSSHGGDNSGTSYANAWQGWSSINWFTSLNGTSTQHTLYVCGNHAYSVNAVVLNAQTNILYPTIIDGNYPADPGKITFSNGAFFSFGNHYKILRNLTLVNGGIYIGYSAICTGGITIDSCSISGVGTEKGVNIAASANSAFTNISIQNCSFKNLGNGIYWFNATTGVAASLDNLIVYNNTFEDIKNIAITLTAVADINYSATYLRNFLIDKNTFNQIGQGASGGQAIRLIANNGNDGASLSYGLVITNNKISNIGYYSTTIDPVGGVSISGFTSPSNSHDKNIIAYNTITNTFGSIGAMDIGRCSYVDCHHNYIDTVAPSSGPNPIDGAGIFIDQSSKEILVHHNTVKNIRGSNLVSNSSYALAHYMNFSSSIYSNLVIGCRFGVWGLQRTYGYTSALSGATSFVITSGADGNGAFSSAYVYKGMRVDCNNSGKIPANTYVGDIIGNLSPFTVNLVNAAGSPVSLTGNLISFTDTLRFDMPETATQTVFNNTFINCDDNGAQFTNYYYAKLVVSNNVFYNQTINTNGFYISNVASITAKNNCTYRQGANFGITLDYTNLNSDPLLDSATYKPLVGSPCLDAGAPVGYLSDFTGRPFSSPPTIGAYESFERNVERGKRPFSPNLRFGYYQNDYWYWVSVGGVERSGNYIASNRPGKMLLGDNGVNTWINGMQANNTTISNQSTIESTYPNGWAPYVTCDDTNGTVTLKYTQGEAFLGSGACRTGISSWSIPPKIPLMLELDWKLDAGYPLEYLHYSNKTGAHTGFYANSDVLFWQFDEANLVPFLSAYVTCERDNKPYFRLAYCPTSSSFDRVNICPLVPADIEVWHTLKLALVIGDPNYKRIIGSFCGQEIDYTTSGPVLNTNATGGYGGGVSGTTVESGIWVYCYNNTQSSTNWDLNDNPMNVAANCATRSITFRNYRLSHYPGFYSLFNGKRT